jgi:hypothetical protein
MHVAGGLLTSKYVGVWVSFENSKREIRRSFLE